MKNKLKMLAISNLLPKNPKQNNPPPQKKTPNQQNCELYRLYYENFGNKITLVKKILWSNISNTVCDKSM